LNKTWDLPALAALASSSANHTHSVQHGMPSHIYEPLPRFRPSIILGYRTKCVEQTPTSSQDGSVL